MSCRGKINEDLCCQSVLSLYRRLLLVLIPEFIGKMNLVLGQSCYAILLCMRCGFYPFPKQEGGQLEQAVDRMAYWYSRFKHTDRLEFLEFCRQALLGNVRKDSRQICMNFALLIILSKVQKDFRFWRCELKHHEGNSIHHKRSLKICPVPYYWANKLGHLLLN